MSRSLTAISFLIMLVVGLAIFYNISYISNGSMSLNATMSDTTSSSSFNVIMGIIPIFVVIAVILSILTFFCRGEESTDDEDEEVVVKRKRRVNAEEVIKMRYAKGEITSEEYTDMMSRL
jgi:uncharacterized membrane protein